MAAGVRGRNDIPGDRATWRPRGAGPIGQLIETWNAR
jgi:hypothetical protein